MIPSDVASRLQVTADAALRPVANIQEITDKLAGLAPGQRLMADIQALMPNGTYRAIINQRDVTLALPFAAKAGDSLELEVVSTDGKLTLAVLSRPPGEGGKVPVESVPTTLSRTGQLIGSLFGNAGDTQSGPAPTALNGNRPLAGSPPISAQDILPQLKQAITRSGLFYESHQAEWVNGRFDKNALLQEPQGRLPPRFAPTAVSLGLLAQNPASIFTPQGQTIATTHPDADQANVANNALPQEAPSGLPSRLAPTATAPGLFAQNPASIFTSQGQMIATTHPDADQANVANNALPQEAPSGLPSRLAPTATAPGLFVQNPAATLTQQGQMIATTYPGVDQANGDNKNALPQETPSGLPSRSVPTATAPGLFVQNPASALTTLGALGELPTTVLPGDVTAQQQTTPTTTQANERFDASYRSIDSQQLPVMTAEGRPEKNTASTGFAAQSSSSSPTTSSTSPSQLVAAPALPLVQQQLEALATQNFVWQGQVWPGQTMRWEIEEEASHRGTESEESDDGDESASRWQTRLRLTLPRLGEVDVQIKLQGQEITLALTTGSANTQSLLRNAAEALRSQLGEAGLALSSLGVTPAKESA